MSTNAYIWQRRLFWLIFTIVAVFVLLVVLLVYVASMTLESGG